MMLLSKASLSSLSSSPNLTDKTKSTNTKHSASKQTAITAVSPTANQVVIIHQNNALTTSAMNPYLASDLFSSMSSSSSSSLGLANHIANNSSTIQNDLDSFEFADASHSNSDVKYMKGYVNVIKERFARRSLSEKSGSSLMINEQQLNNNNNNHQGAIRLSINDYQRRKQQTSGHSVVNTTSSNKSRNASVDYQRTRSVSPFTSHYNLNNQSKVLNSDLTDKNLSLFGKSNSSSGRGGDDQKSLHSLSSSSPSQSSESPSPMSSNFSSPTNDDFKSKKASSSISITSTSEVIKCTYLNEINKDELPKPNFVSSVKNLFEKQITNQFTSNSMIEPRQSHSAKPRHKQRQSLVETTVSLSNNKMNSPKSNPTYSIGSNSKLPLKKSISIESLVDRLKQNGTLVYEHSEKENVVDSETLFNKYGQQEYMQSENVHSLPPSSTSTTSSNNQSNNIEPLLPVSLNTLSNKVSLVTEIGSPLKSQSTPKPDSPPIDKNSMQLSFRERKEIFNKNTSSLVKPPTKSSQHLSKRQKIELLIDSNGKLTDESSDFINDDDCSLSSSSSLNKLDESRNNQLEEDVAIGVTNDQNDSMSANDVLNCANEKQSQNLKKSQTPVKVITFYGGEEIKDVKALNLPTLKKPSELNINPVSTNSVFISNHTFTPTLPSNESIYYEFSGAGVKLDRSNLSASLSNSKRNRKKLDSNGCTLRVNFTDIAETYEYPSYEFMLKELGIDPLTDPDYQQQTDTIVDSIMSNDSQFSNGLSSFLPGRSFNEYDDETNENSSNTNRHSSNEDNLGFNKLGSFTNFKPSWHNMSYELGSMESFEHQSNQSRHNSSTSSPLKTNSKQLNSDSFILSDILPSKDDYNKRWSSEMDSNILF